MPHSNMHNCETYIQGRRRHSRVHTMDPQNGVPLGGRTIKAASGWHAYISPSQRPIPLTVEMCYRSRFRNKYLQCHEHYSEYFAWQMIDCMNPRCRLSSQHPATCPYCPITCAQSETADVQYNRDCNARCAHCTLFTHTGQFKPRG
ncbi:hypothetical protein BDZ89DRAFT_562263 [Hymenopellis radicata]|nr:hypothetical protein BDZ89DRAFT_562263 [Hymenopellis radicata]